MSANLVANVTISGNTLVLAASSNVQYINAASSNIFTFAAGIATVNKFPAVAGGALHTAVLLADGTVRTFGGNNSGQLGLGDTTQRVVPVTVSGIAGATAVACGSSFTAVLLADGTVRTFGLNNYGQLGVNDTTDRVTPVQVFGISSSAVAVACGYYHTAVLLADGTVRTFGDNTYGQLGINVASGTRQTPVTVVNISTATAVAGGQQHTLVLLADGTVRTFGDNSFYQLGINVSGGTRQTPVQVFGISSSAVAVACGRFHNAVLLADGTVRTFGFNGSGRLGDNTTVDKLTPVTVLNITSATAVAGGYSHTTVLLADGTVRTCGENSFGQLGVNDTTTRQTPAQVFGISSSATFIASGWYHNAVILSDGTLRTFGQNNFGQLGLGDTVSRLTPVQVVSALSYGGGVGKVAGGGYHTAVILADGTVRTFGAGSAGRLGVGDTNDRPTPVQVFGISSSAMAVACGRYHTAVILTDGTVRTFGRNVNGQLGLNDTIQRNTPVQVFGISSSATAVACGRYHKAVLLADGTVRTFGRKTDGQLGVNDTTNRSTPVQVFGISSSATAIACGYYVTAILLADGTVRTFGRNTNGQLGVNDTTNRSTPVQVFGISSSATAVACGGYHTAVLLADGSVRTVGYNNSGQLGFNVNDGTTRQTPVQVWGISSSAMAVACGADHTAVLLANGTIRTFGAGSAGRLGVGDTNNRLTPVQVFGISSSATAVACGGYHTAVLLANGTVQTFGGNAQGQLGVNDLVSRQTPVQVLNIYTAGSLASTVYLTSAQTGFTFNGPVFTTNLGLGRVPDISYQLDLSSDGARKLQSSTWTTGSDRRIKSDIQTANLARCAEIVDSLDLKYFEWLSASHTDRHSLGWIAQDVLTFFPKSVSLTQSGTLALDSDQLVKVLWGALKHTLNEHFAPEVPVVPEIPVASEPVPETSESLSVPEASENLSEPVTEVPEVTEVTEVTEPVPEVPAVSEPVAEVTVPEVTEVTEPVPEVTEVPEVPPVSEPVPVVTEVPVVPEVTEVPAVTEPVAEVTEVPATTESLSVDPGTEVSESLSENTVEVPAVSEVPDVPDPAPESVPE